MIKYTIYIILLISLFTYQSCTKSAIFNEGDIVSETRSLPDFSYLEIDDVFDITLIDSSVSGVIITCGERLMSGIETSYSDDTLIIRNTNSFEWTRDYERVKLVIFTDRMEKIRLSAPCNLKTEGVYKNDRFIVWATSNLSQVDLDIEVGYFNMLTSWLNTGDYSVRGTAAYTYLMMCGSSITDASELISNEMYVHHRSIGDLEINVTTNLEYDIKSTGNIICYSTPTSIIEHIHTGTGELIIVN